MVLGVQRRQSRLRHMRVNLGGRQAAVTQQHLQAAQIGAMIQQMRGEGMTQGMRRIFGFYSGPGQVFLDILPEGLARDRAAPTR